MNELQELLQILRKCVKRPTMYSVHPEGLELLCQHLAHICYSTLDKTWTWQSTQLLWQRIAGNLGNEERFAIATYETFEYRHEKWGLEESDVQGELLKILKDIWGMFWPEKITYSNTASWIEELFHRPDLLGSPDCTDLIMRILIGFALCEHNKAFNEIYIEYCFKLRGSASRGFNSYRTVKDWTTFSHKINQEEYNRVTLGINLVIEDIGARIS